MNAPNEDNYATSPSSLARSQRQHPHPKHQLNADESEYMDLLYDALSKAQGEYPPIPKNAKGAFGRYATLDAILEAVTPANARNGLALKFTTQIQGEDDVLVTTLTHKSGQFTRSVSRIHADPTKPQAYLSYCTYMRRLHAQSLCGVAADTDDDGTGATDAAKRDGIGGAHRLENLALQKLRSCTGESERNEVIARVALRVGKGEMTESQLEYLQKEADSLNKKG
jgi:hypothetical protein